jgi:hypothetical protein
MHIASLRGDGLVAGGGGTGSRAVVRSEPPSVSGPLEAGTVVREVRARMGVIKSCYERGLQRDPKLTGRLVLRWTITAAGAVEALAVESNTVAAPEVTSCLTDVVTRWRFPGSTSGPTVVAFPFSFTSTG